jgi:hypothetical protein
LLFLQLAIERRQLSSSSRIESGGCTDGACKIALRARSYYHGASHLAFPWAATRSRDHGLHVRKKIGANAVETGLVESRIHERCPGRRHGDVERRFQRCCVNLLGELDGILQFPTCSTEIEGQPLLNQAQRGDGQVLLLECKLVGSIDGRRDYIAQSFDHDGNLQIYVGDHQISSSSVSRRPPAMTLPIIDSQATTTSWWVLPCRATRQALANMWTVELKSLKTRKYLSRFGSIVNPDAVSYRSNNSSFDISPEARKVYPSSATLPK